MSYCKECAKTKVLWGDDTMLCILHEKKEEKEKEKRKKLNLAG